MEIIKYPSGEGWFVRTLRFCNALDDGHNMLSPVKLNVWSANVSGASTVFAAVIAWVSAHFTLLEHITAVAPLVGGYLVQAHVTHHYDKRERNLQAARLKSQPVSQEVPHQV